MTFRLSTSFSRILSLCAIICEIKLKLAYRVSISGYIAVSSNNRLVLINEVSVTKVYPPFSFLSIVAKNPFVHLRPHIFQSLCRVYDSTKQTERTFCTRGTRMCISAWRISHWWFLIVCIITRSVFISLRSFMVSCAGICNWFRYSFNNSLGF